MELKLELIAEDEEREIFKVEDNITIGIIFEKKENKAIVVRNNIVVDEYIAVSNEKEIEEIINKKAFDIAVKTAYVWIMETIKKDSK